VPIYEYKCEKCAHEFELLQKMDDLSEVRCSVCGGRVQKLMSRGSFVVNDGTSKHSSDLTKCGRSSTCCGSDLPCSKTCCDD